MMKMSRLLTLLLIIIVIDFIDSSRQKFSLTTARSGQKFSLTTARSGQKFRGRARTADPIKFPSEPDSWSTISEDETIIDESILIRARNVKSLDEFLKAIKVDVVIEMPDDPNDTFSGRQPTKFAEQALCQPEPKTVELEVQQNSNSVFFPKCVRVPRCGGCCGLSHLIDCVPTKVSQKSLKRARIRVKRSTGASGRAVTEATHEIIKVDIHEECKCQCKVQKKHCDSSKHVYKPDLCKCQCINADDENQCNRSAKNKIWDNNECGCKCRNTKLCSSGSIFSHNTCR